MYRWCWKQLSGSCRIVMKNSIYIFVILFSISLNGQSLKNVLKKYNTESIPYVTVEATKANPSYILLDARELKEFKVSHLKNAIQVGYDSFNLKETATRIKDKSATIVVYCSVGIRSEDIAEKLKKSGFKNVYNLYGGIFEWKNKLNIVVDSLNQPTEKVHTFSKEWSKWLKKGIKIYE